MKNNKELKYLMGLESLATGIELVTAIAGGKKSMLKSTQQKWFLTQVALGFLGKKVRS